MAPYVSDDELLKAQAAFELHNTKEGAATALGIPTTTLKNRLKIAHKRGLHLSDGARHAMNLVDLNGMEIAGGWRHAYDESGNKIETVRYSIPKSENSENDESLLERAREAFQSLKPITAIEPPEATQGDLCTLYPLFDVHLGMHAWARETGGDDYDLKLAVNDLKQAMGDVMSWTPDSEKGIVLIGGDYFHGDDSTNQTPKSRHALDVDGRHFKVLEVGIEATAHLIETALSKHLKVYVRVMRGNHDEHSHMALSFALAQRYRDNTRVTVELNPRDLFMYQHGKCMITAHHGDKAKPQQLIMMLAEVCPFWSESRHRVVFTGHVHHDQVKDFPGIRWESVRAFCPPDAYGANFAPRRAMQAITFHCERGIVLRAIDPIARSA